MNFKLRPLLAGLAMAASLPVAVAAPAADPVRVYVMECGNIEVSDISVFSPGVDKDKKKVLTDSCYLIKHPKGTLIWDTGFSDQMVTLADGKVISPLFHVRVKKTLASQLKEIGVAPESVTYMAVSHMHFDHIGNVGLFPKSMLLMQKEEYASAFGPDAAKFGNDPATYPTLSSNPVTQLEGDHDVFGDGSVIIKRALGHTPGHQALFLKLKKTGNVFLSGDMAHFTSNWEHRRVPSFNFDKERSVTTMNEMADFMKKNKATLWIQHDLEQNDKIRHAPKFYD